MTAPEPTGLNKNIEIPKNSLLYKSACVFEVDDGLKAACEKNITYPIMIKASEGGGGKGIRKCVSEQNFTKDFNQVKVCFNA